MSQLTTADEERRCWVKCTSCSRLLYAPKHERNLNVCSECGHHERLTAHERIAQLVDSGTFRPLAIEILPVDDLNFVDSRPYTDRLADAISATDLQEAVVVGTGRIDGTAVVLAVMDFRFLGGSLGAGTGELIARAVDHAIETSCPFVVVTASGGARMQEGTLSLVQMASISQVLSRLRAAGLLSVSVLTDPTFGGVAASFATNVDVVIAERGARMGFAGRRVIAQTVGVELPADFQTAAFLLEHGHVDLVFERRDLRATLGRLVGFTRPAHRPVATPTVPSTVIRRRSAIAPVVETRAAAETIALARDIRRPTFLDYLGMLVDDFVEFHGDRASADDPALVAGIGRLRGRPAALLGQQRGHSTGELVARGFGMPTPAGYRKATRVIKLASRIGLPIVCLIDTPGAHPGPQSEKAGQAGAIAECIQTLGESRSPVVSVITGEGGSGGALALGVADEVLMLENAMYSVISPEGCATILWGTADRAAHAAEALRVGAEPQLALGVVDGIVSEPDGGAHTNPHATAEALADAIVRALDLRHGIPSDELIAARSNRFRRLSAARVRRDNQPWTPR